MGWRGQSSAIIAAMKREGATFELAELNPGAWRNGRLSMVVAEEGLEPPTRGL